MASFNLAHPVYIQVGQLILAGSANTNLKRVTLELGGKSPMIIFPDADRECSIFSTCFCCWCFREFWWCFSAPCTIKIALITTLLARYYLLTVPPLCGCWRSRLAVCCLGYFKNKIDKIKKLDSDFWFDVKISEWRPWRPFTQQSAVLPPSEWKWNVCHHRKNRVNSQFLICSTFIFVNITLLSARLTPWKCREGSREKM